MKKFVINLERRKDRKMSFLNRNTTLTDVYFSSAVDGQKATLAELNQIGVKTAPNWRDPFRNRKITKGEIGCVLSHYNVWQQCITLNEPIIVFEDDAIITDKFNETYLQELVSTFNFIYLQRNENEPELVKPINEDLEIPYYPYNLTAYVITPEAAKILVSGNILQNLMPADEYVPAMLKYLKPAAFKIDWCQSLTRTESPSDIEPNNEDDYFIDFRVHILTVGTDRKKCVRLNDSGAKNRIYPKNLGNNQHWQGTDMSGPGGGHKLNLVKQYLQNVPDTDVILFTDAYDVFYASDLETIVKRYIGFNTRLLFSAEQYCWPDSNLADKFPETDTPYRYLNSGTYIGEAQELKKILNPPIDNSADDQLFIQQAFLSGLYDIKLDTECYIFQTHDDAVSKNNTQLYNKKTSCFPCIYHGNGGAEAKEKFESLYNEFYPKSADLFLPTYDKFDVIEKDMLVVDFMTQSQCEDLIDIADRHGGWGSLSYDKFPAQEIRIKQLGLWDQLEKHWEKHLYPVIEKYWAPIEMYGLRDAFVMRYAMDTQVSLAYHNDASMVTGSVKLNEDYEGANLVYPRQNISNIDIPVGRCMLFPGMVTHGHECLPLQSGVKYSLTMWTSRYPGDIL